MSDPELDLLTMPIERLVGLYGDACADEVTGARWSELSSGDLGEILIDRINKLKQEILDGYSNDVQSMQAALRGRRDTRACVLSGHLWHL